jgi:hypothetical protein
VPAGAGADGDGDKGGGAEAAEAAAAHQQPGGPAALTGDGAAREGASAAGAAGAGGRFLGTRENYIVQRYIAQPALLGGRKFDIRCFLLVAAAKPHWVVLYGDGYVRASLTPYSADAESLGDRFMHLTNAAVQKKHADFAARGEEAVRSMAALDAALAAQGDAPPGFVCGALRTKMMAVAREVFEAAREKLVRRRGLFELLGLDFMLDRELRPWLLEARPSPGPPHPPPLSY